MQVWTVLHAARRKCRTQKSRQKSPSGHHSTTLSGYIFPTKACIDNRKKLVKQQYLLHMTPQYGEVRPTSGWDRFGSLGHPRYFQRLPRLGSVTVRQSSSDVSWFRYCTDVVQRRSTKLWAGTLYITFSTGLLIYRNFCQVQNSLCVQLLRSPIGTLLHARD